MLVVCTHKRVIISVGIKLQKITVVETNYDILLQSWVSKMKNFDHEMYNIKKYFFFSIR